MNWLFVGDAGRTDNLVEIVRNAGALVMNPPILLKKSIWLVNFRTHSKRRGRTRGSSWRQTIDPHPSITPLPRKRCAG
ncbi:MAG: hypothetical protein MZV63_72075 [Marinilabiliales bacterium]|nr:hypothetical protein [Marinilabiliales bacterium]